MPKLKPFEELTFSDNFMFQQVMRKESLCKRFLETLINIKIEELTYVEPEKVIENKYGHKGVRLDVYVKDNEGNYYDVEMQVSNKPELELFKRARFYQSMIDMADLKQGANYTELRKSYVIFICPFDPFGKHRRVYSFKHYCTQDKDLELQDGTNVIFLNSKGYGDKIAPETGDLLNLVENEPVETEFGKELKDELIIQKINPDAKEGYMAFTNAVLDEIIEARAEGEARGRAEGAFSNAVISVRNMMETLKFTAQAAMDALKIAPADRPAILAAL